jgi:DNA-binding NarL/FixJ family response regulator
MPRRAFDPIAVIEEGYALERSDHDWLAALASTAKPGCDRGLGVSANLWQREPGGSLRSVCDVSPSEDHERVRASIFATIPAEVAPTYYRHAPQVNVASTLPDETMRAMALGIGRQQLGASVEDLWGMVVGDGHSHGIVLTAYATSRIRESRAGEARWMRIACHLGAALRLRTNLSRRALRSPEAILDGEGRALHAEGDAKSTDARARLRTAVRAIDRARGSLRRRDPDEALAIWRALVAGRWSVIDWVDSDGRRLLVAHENGVESRGPAALTARERDVAEYVVHGRSNGEIAYALGLSTGTVNRLARDAMRKLGGARRTDLARIFGARELNAARLDDPPDVVVLDGVPRGAALWRTLTESERQVARLAMRGLSNRAIAAERGRAERTVANQLAATYARFQVRGRAELAALLGPTAS